MILSKVKQFIEHQQLIPSKGAVIVALSGGRDSVALLHILDKLGYSCIAAHCNFHLRSEESMRDQQFVTDLCQQQNIPLHIQSFNTTKYANEKHISIEMAARELRYRWFHNLSQSLHIPHIAVAHHRDDSIETILLNLIRGTGIQGLRGICPKNNQVVRPLLCLTQAEVDQYIQEHNLQYVDDSTNQETTFRRNKIRHEIIPLLESINPAFKASLFATSKHLQSVNNIYRRWIEQAIAEVKQENIIHIPILQKQPEYATVLFEILHPLGFVSPQIEQIARSLEAPSGKTFFSETHRIVKDRDTLIITQKDIPKQHNELYLIHSIDDDLSHLPINLHITIIDSSTQHIIQKNKHILSVDYNKIEFPLILRRWQHGDRFIPFGMSGSQKISDLFNNLKMSLIKKEQAWILESNNQIVWVVGIRADNRFRIDSQTQSILEIRLD